MKRPLLDQRALVALLVTAAYLGVAGMAWYAWRVYDRVRGVREADTLVQGPQGELQALAGVNGTLRWMPLKDVACAMGVGESILNTTRAFEQNITGVPKVIARSSGPCTANETIVTAAPLAGGGSPWEPLGFDATLAGGADGAFLYFDATATPAPGEWTAGNPPCSVVGEAGVTGTGLTGAPLDFATTRADGTPAQASDVLFLSAAKGKWEAGQLGQGVEVHPATFGANSGGTGTAFTFAADETTAIGALMVWNNATGAWVASKDNNGGAFSTAVRPRGNTVAELQEAIDQASLAGGGIVYPADAEVTLTAALRIPSNVRLDCGGKRLLFAVTPAIVFDGKTPQGGFDVDNAGVYGCTLVPTAVVAVHSRVAVVGAMDARLRLRDVTLEDLHIGCPAQTAAVTEPDQGMRAVTLEYGAVASVSAPTSERVTVRDVTARRCTYAVEVHMDVAYLRVQKVSVYAGTTTEEIESTTVALHGVETGPTLLDTVEYLEQRFQTSNEPYTYDQRRGRATSVAHVQNLIATGFATGAHDLTLYHTAGTHTFGNGAAKASKATTNGNLYQLWRGTTGIARSTYTLANAYSLHDEQGACQAPLLRYSSLGAFAGTSSGLSYVRCVRDMQFVGVRRSTALAAPAGRAPSIAFYGHVRDVQFAGVMVERSFRTDTQKWPAGKAYYWDFRAPDVTDSSNVVVHQLVDSRAGGQTAGRNCDCFSSSGQSTITHGWQLPMSTLFMGNGVHSCNMYVAPEATDAVILGGSRYSHGFSPFTYLNLPAVASGREILTVATQRALVLGVDAPNDHTVRNDGASASLAVRYHGSSVQAHYL